MTQEPDRRRALQREDPFELEVLLVLLRELRQLPEPMAVVHVGDGSADSLNRRLGFLTMDFSPPADVADRSRTNRAGTAHPDSRSRHAATRMSQQPPCRTSAIGPEPHPNFIDVFCQAPLRDGRWRERGGLRRRGQSELSRKPGVSRTPKKAGVMPVI
jgi:hypothetical protein